MTKRLLADIWLVPVFTGMMSTAALAEQYFVAPNGNDADEGTSWDTAWRTPAHAASLVSPGDIVTLRNGSTPYDGFVIHRSGLPDKPIVFRGESPATPPVFSGASQKTNWIRSENHAIWKTFTSSKPIVLLEDGIPVPPATSPDLEDGRFYWADGVLHYRPLSSQTDGAVLADDSVVRQSKGGGIMLNTASHVSLENFQCHVGGAACVTIRNGHNNVIRDFTATWYWRAVDIDQGSSGNLVESCVARFNREGIYIRGGSSNNRIRECTVDSNGTLPAWKQGDRAGIAIGEAGPHLDNYIGFNTVTANGGPDSDAAIVAYHAPGTTIEGNNVDSNFGSGIFVTLGSDNSIVRNNVVTNNGVKASNNGLTNIAGLAVRRSSSVTVIDNRIRSNHVTNDNPWGTDSGPRGALDIRALPADRVSDLFIDNNIIEDTRGGPNLYIHPDIPLRAITGRDTERYETD